MTDRLDSRFSAAFGAQIAAAIARGLGDLGRVATALGALRREGVDRRDLAEWAALGTPALPLLEALRDDFARRRAWARRSGERLCPAYVLEHDNAGPCPSCGAAV